MHNNARQHRTLAVAEPGRKAKKGGATAKSLHAIGGLFKEPKTSDEVQVNSDEGSGNDVSRPKVVRLFTEPHAKKQEKPKPVPGASQKAASGKGKKDKVSPSKAEDTPPPAEVKVPSTPPSDEVEVSTPPGADTNIGTKTNRLEGSELGLCIVCDIEMKHTAYGSWSVAEAFLDKDGKLSRNKKGEVINLKKGAPPVKGFTCSKGCDEKMEKSRHYLG